MLYHLHSHFRCFGIQYHWIIVSNFLAKNRMISVYQFRSLKELMSYQRMLHSVRPSMPIFLSTIPSRLALFLRQLPVRPMTSCSVSSCCCRRGGLLTPHPSATQS